MWLHELLYRAKSWEAQRRVILVVKEREGDLLLDRFFLVTSLEPGRQLPREVPDHIRERGKAEGHMGGRGSVMRCARRMVPPGPCARQNTHASRRPTRYQAVAAAIASIAAAPERQKRSEIPSRRDSMNKAG